MSNSDQVWGLTLSGKTMFKSSQYQVDSRESVFDRSNVGVVSYYWLALHKERNNIKFADHIIFKSVSINVGRIIIPSVLINMK